MIYLMIFAAQLFVIGVLIWGFFDLYNEYIDTVEELNDALDENNMLRLELQEEMHHPKQY